MKHISIPLTIASLTVVLATTGLTGNVQAQQDFRRLPMKLHVDKMKAGWLGQMAGVGWGGNAEWRRRGRLDRPGSPPQVVMMT